jgi:hypothetical protein
MMLMSMLDAVLPLSWTVTARLTGSMEHWAGSGRVDGTSCRLAVAPGPMWDLDNTPLGAVTDHDDERGRRAGSYGGLSDPSDDVAHVASVRLAAAEGPPRRSPP